VLPIMSQTVLYLIRHGQTQWNAEHRMQGFGDSPLTELGNLQATWARDAFRNKQFAAIYASTSLRALYTAEIIRGSRQQPITTYKDLRELNMGCWEGCTVDEIRQQYPKEYQLFWKHPQLYRPSDGGETFAELQKRVVALTKKLIQRHPDQCILIVSHTIAIKTLLSHFMQQPLEQLWQTPTLHPVSLSKVIVTDNMAHVESYGDVSFHHFMPHTTSMQERAANRA
jgi:Fructose-2,6-bisphosphatase